MKLQVLGSGCAKCKMLEASVIEAVKAMGSDAEVVKVTDIDEILDMGVMITPALAIDGDVKSSGKVLTLAEVQDFIKAAL